MIPGAPQTDGLSTEQAPPLSIPAGFFLVAPVALVAAGALMIAHHRLVFLSGWMPVTLATTHLGTIGVLAAVMLGALYQMTPVVAGAPVPLVRLAHLVLGALVVGLAALVSGLLLGRPPLMWIATVALGSAALLFLAPVAAALARAPANTATVNGMRLAVLAFAVLVGLGVRMAYSHAAMAFPDDRLAWLATHAGLGFICWVGGLIVAVSWQVVPMFYLTPAYPRWATRTTLAGLALSLVGAVVALTAGLDHRVRTLTLLPGALVVWLLHPLLTLALIRRRKRRRSDASLDFWRLGLVTGVLALVAAVANARGIDGRWEMSYGWLVIWGWAGLIVHGMLTRIVPFLVWFHRFSPLVGRAPVPPMRKLLPDRRARLGLWLHAGAVALGLAAIWTAQPIFARAAGAALIGTGVVLAVNLIRALAWRLPAPTG